VALFNPDKPLQDTIRNAEAGLAQTAHRDPEVQQPLPGAGHKHAQGPGERKPAPLGLSPSTSLVDGDLAGA